LEEWLQAVSYGAPFWFSLMSMLTYIIDMMPIGVIWLMNDTIDGILRTLQSGSTTFSTSKKLLGSQGELCSMEYS
jgi:hypothetical protein